MRHRCRARQTENQLVAHVMTTWTNITWVSRETYQYAVQLAIYAVGYCPYAFRVHTIEAERRAHGRILESDGSKIGKLLFCVHEPLGLDRIANELVVAGWR